MHHHQSPHAVVKEGLVDVGTTAGDTGVHHTDAAGVAVRLTHPDGRVLQGIPDLRELIEGIHHILEGHKGAAGVQLIHPLLDDGLADQVRRRVQADVGHPDQLGKLRLAVEVLGVHPLALLPGPLLDGLLSHVDGHAELVHPHHLVLEHLVADVGGLSHDAVMFGDAIIAQGLGGQHHRIRHIDAGQHPMDVRTLAANLRVHRVLLEPGQLQCDVYHFPCVHVITPYALVC